MRHLFNRLKAWLRTPQPPPDIASTHPVIASEARQSMPPTHDAHAHLVPYDENLLERSRTQWQFGDWVSLAALDRDTLQHHPDRAKLALLAAAGHQGLGNSAEARQHTRLAIDWGCSKKLVTQILISGVHNTLGRAAAVSGQEQRANKHFQASIEAGAPSSAVKLLVQARAGKQLSQLGLSTPQGHINLNVDNESSNRLGAMNCPDADIAVQSSTLISFSQSIQDITDTLKQQKAELDIHLKQQAKELTRVSNSLSKAVKTEITIATKQLEAFFGIQSYFESGNVLGELHGWPISPDLGLYLIQQLDAKAYDLVIEFGSGTSTQLIAKALATIAQRQPTRIKPVQVAFEHLERYHQMSLALLQQSGLAEVVTLHYTPLKSYTGPDCEDYLYYDCEPALQALAKASKNNSVPVILVLADGPPEATGLNARYPALPLLLQHFPAAQIDLILDDYNRPGEKEVVTKWLNYLEALQRHFERVEQNFDKGACKLSIEPRNQQA